MSSKGDLTKKRIQQCAWELFATKGFTAVTMKDVCEATGLSRGGLYRHYAGTDEIFRDMFSVQTGSQTDFIDEGIREGRKAVQILDQLFSVMEEEMNDSDRSLSLAIYEYAQACDRDFLQKMHDQSVKRWRRLLDYGMASGEFNSIKPESFIDLLLYSYQGVRICSRMLEKNESSSRNILASLRQMLVCKPNQEVSEVRR